VLLAAVERVRGVAPIDDPTPVLAPTPDVRRASLCAVSGMAATDRCVRRVSEWVPAERAPGPCEWHHDTEHGLVTIWPRVYEYWARLEGLWREPFPVSAVPASAATVERGAGDRTPGLAIVAPVSGATYSVDPTLRAEFQTLALRATGAARDDTLEWLVDGRPVGVMSSGGTVRWPMTRGTHAISVRSQSGQSAAITVEVR
jgi:membrane carboxypeptidase/penicillin-binding protein PbpC